MSPLSKPTTAGHAKSALTRISQATVAAVKATITADFSDMTKWAVVSGTPTISSGELTGKTAVRYIDEMATDDYTVTATVGALHDGRTWLVTCTDPSFSRFYALELNKGFGGTIWSIISGTGVVATTSTGLFGIVSGIIGFLMGYWDDIIAALFGENAEVQAVIVGDEVSVYWDEEDSVVRAYLNGVQVTSLSVPRHELQHTAGRRYFGIVSGIDHPAAPGIQFNAIEAVDV